MSSTSNVNRNRAFAGVAAQIVAKPKITNNVDFNKYPIACKIEELLNRHDAEQLKQIMNILEDSFLNESFFRSESSLPTIFSEVSNLLTETSETKNLSKQPPQSVKNFAIIIVNLHKFLLANESLFCLQKPKEFYDKCLRSIVVLENYLSVFYQFILDEQENLIDVSNKIYTANALLECYEDVKKLEAVEKGESCGDELTGNQLQHPFTATTKLGLGGKETLNFWRRLNPVKGETFGNIVFSAGCEVVQWGKCFSIQGLSQPNSQFDGGPKLDQPAITPDFNNGYFLGIVTAPIMAFGFAIMTTSSHSIGYKVKLQKTLLTHLYERIGCDELLKLSSEMQNDLKKYLTKSDSKIKSNSGPDGLKNNGLSQSTDSEDESSVCSSPSSLSENTVVPVSDEDSDYESSEPSLSSGSISENNILGINYDHEASKYLLSSYDINLVFEEIIGLQKGIASTSVKPSLNYNVICKLIKAKEADYNLESLVNSLRTTSIELKPGGRLGQFLGLSGKWGTYLDLIYEALDQDGKSKLINDLKEDRLFKIPLGSTRKNEIDYVLESDSADPEYMPKAVKYMMDSIEKKTWSNKKEATSEISAFVFDLLSSRILSFEQRRFLLNILQRSLMDRGEIADKTRKRVNAKRDFAISLFYIVPSLVCLSASFLWSPVNLGYNVVKIIAGGDSAIPFGALAYVQCNEVCGSTKQARKKVSSAISVMDNEIAAMHENITIAANQQSNDTLMKTFGDFLSKCHELNNSKNQLSELNFQLILEQITYFKNRGLLKFLLEFNHGMKDCPLYILQNKILSSQLKGKRGEFDKILNLLYREEVLENIKEIRENIYSVQAVFEPYITPAMFEMFLSNGEKITQKTSKAALLYSAKVLTLLNIIKDEGKPGVYIRCFQIFQNALKKVERGENSSWLNNLTKRHASSYLRRRIIGRVVANVVCGTMTILFPPAALVFIVLDFVGRKYAERFEYSDRITFFKWKIKGYRYFEVMMDYVDFTEQENPKVSSLPTVKKTAVQALKELDKNSSGDYFDLINNSFRDSFDEYEREELHTILENISFIEIRDRNLRLEKEINLLLARGAINKEHACKAILASKWLIAECNRKDFVTEQEALNLESKLAVLSMFGPNSRVLSTRRTTNAFLSFFPAGAEAYLLGDFIAASVTVLQQIFKTIIPSFAAAMNSGSVWESAAKSFSLQVGLDVVGFGLWMHEIDIRRTGWTGTSQAVVGSIKKGILAYNTCEPNKLAESVLAVSRGRFSRFYKWAFKPKSVKTFRALLRSQLQVVAA